MNITARLIRNFILIFAFLISNHVISQTKKDNLVQHSGSKSWLEMIQDPDVDFTAAQSAFNTYWKNKSNYKGNGYKVFKRWEYINESRVLPNGKLQAPGYVSNEYNKYMQTQLPNKSATGTWTLVGPDSYPANATVQPTGMGRVNALAFHPTDANTIYVGSPSGGFWKTTDAGLTWINLSNDLPKLGVSSILIHPTNPDIIYIGSGDRDAGDAPGMGVFKSIDGGASWSQINSTMGDVTVGAMLMHPTDPNIILAATKTGVYKTINGGSSWSLKQAGDFRDIKYKPGDPSIVYAALFSSNGSKFYRSADGGELWTNISEGNSLGPRMVIGVSAANPSLVVLLKTGPYQSFSSLGTSTDNGLHFTNITQSSYKNLMGYMCDGTDASSQAVYDMCMAIDPTDVNTIYIGGINIWKTTDGGLSFSIVAHWEGSSYSTCGAASVHADHHCLEWSPHTARLFTGNDGGVHWTGNSGSSWSEISSGLAIAQVYKIGQSKTHAGYVMLGEQDNGSAFADNGNLTTVIGGDGMECLIDPTDANYRYVSNQSGAIYRSTGSTYNYITGGAVWVNNAWVTPYTLHETNPNTMFLGYQSIQRCLNVKSAVSQITWEEISPSGDVVRVLEQSPANVDVMYGVRNGAIIRSDNVNASAGSVSWTQCALPLGLTPTDMEAHPNDANIVFATAGYKVFKSSDKGISWTDISGNLPPLFINCVVYDKNSDEGLYIGNQTGVWFKDANMPNWVLYSQGLPPVDIRELEIYYDPSNASNNRIKAATYGRGLWQSDLIEYTVIDPSDITVSATGTSQIDLTWTQNSNNNDVMVVWSAAPTFGIPVNGASYSAGNTISGGGTVLYSGSLTSFNHTGLTTNVVYHYKIWSVDGSLNYSSGTMVSAQTMCSIYTAPFTESFDGSSIPDCWTQLDQSGIGQVWKSGAFQDGNLPLLNGNYAYLNSFDYGSGFSQNADLITPTINLSANSFVSLTFNHYYRHATGSSASVYYSINNGATWNLISTFSASTTNPAPASFSVPGAAGQSQVKFKWNYSGSYGYYWAIDDIQVSSCTGIWTGATSTAWNVATNWCNNTVPVATTDVYIPAGVSNMPLISSTSNIRCRNITIAEGATLTMSASVGSLLEVAGDWTNHGTFVAGIGTITFNGTNNLQTVKGSAVTNFNKLTLVKGAQDRILEVTSLIGLTNAANPLTLTSGTFKLSSASVITPFTSAVNIVALAGFWNNGGTVTAGAFSWTINGLLRMSAGSINIGTAQDHNLVYNNNSKITIEGGTLNVAGRFYSGGNTTYNQSGGVFTVCKFGSTNTSIAPFDFNAASSFTMSGGSIVIPKASSSTSDYKNLATTNNVTGGTLQIGDAATSGSPIIRIYSTAPIYNLLINETGTPTAYIITSNLTVKNDVTINAGTLWIGTMLLTGGNFINNGSIATGSSITFNGTAPQTHSGTNNSTFYNMTLNNTAGLTLSGYAGINIRNILTLTAGVIKTGQNKISLILTGASVARTSGHVFGNLQKKMATGSNLSKTFETGDSLASMYTPVALTFANISTSGDIMASTQAGDHQVLYASQINNLKTVNRTWTLSNTGTVFTTYDAVFNFPTSDLDNGVNTSNLVCGKYSASNWTYPTMGNKTSNSTQILGVTSFGEFQLGEIGCSQPDVPTLSATSNSICMGSEVSLSVIAGYLNGAETWYWYEGSCGGTPIGTGSSLLVSPTATTTYFARGEGGCAATGICASVEITVNMANAPAGDPLQSFCDEATIAGLQATGNEIKWYDASTGGNLLQPSYVLSTSTLYYASQTIGGCESTSRLEVTAMIYPSYDITENHTISTGQTFTWQGIDYTTAGTYYANYISKHGCDSSFTLNLTVTGSGSKTLNLKLFLEGLYAGGSLMNQAQGDAGPQFAAGIADKVDVALHFNTNPYGIFYEVNDIDLHTDGTLLLSNLPANTTNSYYITIKHRNSIETWSAFPYDFSGQGPFSYDFSIAASQAYGDNQKLMGTVYAIWGGDPTQDGIVDGSDMSVIDNGSQPPILHGYYPEDVNGDGIVDGSDMSMVDNNSAPPPVYVIRP